MRPALLQTLTGESPLSFRGARGERLRIDVLENDVVRVRFHPSGSPRLARTWMMVGPDGDAPREGRSRDDLSAFSCPPADIATAEGVVSVRTSSLTLDLRLADATLQWRNQTGQVFAADLPGRAYEWDRDSASVWHYMRHTEGDHYYGFGERAGDLDHAGQRMRMVNVDAFAYNARTSDPLYKHYPVYLTLVPDLNLVYGLLYDTHASCVFDMACERDAYHGRYRYLQADAGDIDYYMILGPSMERVVEQLSRLTGRMALPPRWALGYLGSTMSYTEAPNAQEQLGRFVELCSEHRIPCDLFHLSSGYTLDAEGRRNVFTWNRQRIPDPAAMVATFTQAGVKLAANVKPCLLTSHPRYGEVAALPGFVQAAESDGPEVSTFWGGLGSYLDFTSPATWDWWKQAVREHVLAYGIVSTWNDNNEFEVWDDAARCAGFGTPLTIGQARPLQTLLMVRASWEAQREARPGERPCLISRAFCPGMQRYAHTWSGDNTSTWETLRYNIPMGLGLSLCGVPHVGHDVGGFAGQAPSPELLVRWVQNGSMHPRFTIHSHHDDGTVNEPWMYPEVLPLIRAAIEFRYRLLPYLYSLFFAAASTGHPIIRPMVYAFPDDVRTHTESFDFMLGPWLLVASVLEDGARERRVYLPRGPEWYCFHTGQRWAGGQEVTMEAPLSRLPLLVPAGGIIPMGKLMRYVGETPDDVRQAFVFPPAGGRSAFTMLEDDGVTEGGDYTRVELSVTATGDSLALEAGATGRYRLGYDHIEMILPPGETRRLDGWVDATGFRHVDIPVQRADPA